MVGELEVNQEAKRILLNEQAEREMAQQEARDYSSYNSLYNRLFGPPPTEDDCSVSTTEQVKRYAKGIGTGVAAGVVGALTETTILCSGASVVCAVAPEIPIGLGAVTILGTAYLGGKAAHNSIKDAEYVCLEKKKSVKK